MKDRRISYFRQKGDAYIMGTSIGLVLSLLMVAFIMGVILVKGLGFFWPSNLLFVKLEDGKAYLGEVTDREEKTVIDASGTSRRLKEVQLKIGNRDLYGLDFIWIPLDAVVKQTYPRMAITIERLEYGNFYGFPQRLHAITETWLAEESGFIRRLQQWHDRAVENRKRIAKLEKRLNRLLEPLSHLEREISLLEISPQAQTPEGQARLQALEEEIARMEARISDRYEALNRQLEKLHQENAQLILTVQTADGAEKAIPLEKIVRFYFPNQMNLFQKSALYASKLWEFVSANPRESNTEGGIFPAIFGTVLMVLIMSIAVVPFGVMAAIYLSEYARQGPVVRLIRLSINNLAGVPSIVFGIFGLSFFIYMIGGTIDQLFFSSKLPEPTFGTGGILWASLTLALLTLPVVVVATEEGILAVPQANKEAALALGATRWQMIRKIVLPNAMPGILTGLILAISRGAGEVAPLMITGVVKLAPSLPLDTTFPFLHLDRKFMHLGFHIYDVGFQSPNVEAAKPMVYTTALLLILLVVVLNMIAIRMRNNLRKKYKMAAF
ncbi:MAG: phosphate ABC transporter permease PstA [Calditrichaeota bacterium]|nr:phosphate ABC transporter permease PstA [Calditrichota bacterium]